LYEQVRRNEERIEKELRFAQRVQAALLPTELPTRLRNADVAGRFEPPTSSGAICTIHFDPRRTRWWSRSATSRGKAHPPRCTARLPRSWCGRAQRAGDIHPTIQRAGVLESMNTILHDRQLEEYYCTLCYALFDFKRKTGHDFEFRTPVSCPVLRRSVRAD
jgi:hypothetical protein